MATPVFTLPDVSVPAAIQRRVRSIVAKWDLQRYWEQTPVAAYLAQSPQTFPSEPWWEIWEIQGLFSGRRKFNRAVAEGKCDQTTPRKLRRVDAYLVCHIDKCLSVIPTEATDQLKLILVHEDSPN